MVDSVHMAKDADKHDFNGYLDMHLDITGYELLLIFF